VLTLGNGLAFQILKVTQGYAKEGLSEDFQKYFILLIITDGVINDMSATVDGTSSIFSSGLV